MPTSTVRLRVSSDYFLPDFLKGMALPLGILWPVFFGGQTFFVPDLPLPMYPLPFGIILSLKISVCKATYSDKHLGLRS